MGVEVDGELARGDRADLVALVAQQFAVGVGHGVRRVGPAVYVVMIAAGVKTVESLVALGLRTSKRDEYATPPAKPVKGLLSGFTLGLPTA